MEGLNTKLSKSNSGSIQSLDTGIAKDMQEGFKFKKEINYAQYMLLWSSLTSIRCRGIFSFTQEEHIEVTMNGLMMI